MTRSLPWRSWSAAPGTATSCARSSTPPSDEGRQELTAWFRSPVRAKSAPRDELAIKLALAVTTPGVDVLGVVQTQRTATMTTLQELTRLKARVTDPDADLAWSRGLDSLVFRAEAEIRWLDHCEARVARAATRRATTGQPAAAIREETRR